MASSIYDNEARKTDRAKNLAAQQQTTASIIKKNLEASKASDGTVKKTVYEESQYVTPSSSGSTAPKTVTTPKTSAGSSLTGDSAVDALIAPEEVIAQADEEEEYEEEEYEEEVYEEEPEEPAFTPYESRSSAVNIVTGTKPQAAARIANQKAELTALNEQESKKPEEPKKDDDIYDNPGRQADRAENLAAWQETAQEREAEKANAAESAVSEYIETDDTGSVFKEEELRELSKYLSGANENEEDYESARIMLDEGAMRAALLGDTNLQVAYENAVQKLDRNRASAMESAKAAQEAEKLAQFTQEAQVYARYLDDPRSTEYAEYFGSADPLTLYANDREMAEILARVQGIADTQGDQAIAYGETPGLYELVQNMMGKNDTAKEYSWVQTDAGRAGIDSLSTMTNEERTVFYTILATEGTEKAKEFIDFLDDELKRRRAEQAAGEIAEFTQDYPLMGALASVGQTPYKMAGAVDAMLSPLFGKEIDPYSSAYDANVMQGAARGTNIAQIEEAIDSDFWEKAAVAAYNAAMSGADSLAASGLPGGAGAAMLASGAASDAAYDAKLRGATDEQAVALAGLAGSVEFLFEKYDLEKLGVLARGETDGFWKAVGKQFLTEGVGEGLTEAANEIADRMIMQEASTFETAVRQYILSGMTMEEARARAAQESAGRVMEATITGAFSGGASAFTAGAPSAISNFVRSDAFKNYIDRQSQMGIVAPGFTIPDPPAAPITAPQTDSAVEALVNPQGVLNELQDPDESTSVNTDPSQHTPVEQAVIDEYQSSVDEGLVQFVEDVKNNQVSDRVKFELDPVSERAALQIKSLIGVDASGFNTAIEPKIVRHIIKRHGENGEHDQSMRDVNDIARIQYVINNYDDMFEGGTAESYTTIKENGKPGHARTVIMTKAVNGTYYVVEAVPDTKRKTTYIVSAYMSKNGQQKRSPHLANASMAALTSTSETGYVDTPISSIDNSSQDVNDGTQNEAPIVDPAVQALIDPESVANDPEVQTQETAAPQVQGAQETERIRPADVTIADTMAGWNAQEIEQRVSRTPESFIESLKNENSTKLVQAIEQTQNEAYRFSKTAQEIKKSLNLDEDGLALYDAIIKNPANEENIRLAVQKYGRGFMAAVRQEISANAAKKQVSDYARAIKRTQHERAEKILGANVQTLFKPTAPISRVTNYLRHTNEVFRNAFSDPKKAKEVHNTIIGSFDTNERIANQWKDKHADKVESLRVNAFESLADMLTSDTGLTKNGAPILTMQEIESLAQANLTRAQVKALAQCAHAMQNATKTLNKQIAKSGMQLETAQVYFGDSKLNDKLPKAVRDAYTAWQQTAQEQMGKAQRVTNNPAALKVTELVGGGHANIQAVTDMRSFDIDKIKQLSKTLDAFYSEAWDAARSVYLLNGYKDIGFAGKVDENGSRYGYRPHTIKDPAVKTRGISELFRAQNTSKLPIAIVGETENFTPGRRYMPNFQASRNTQSASYLDSLAGFYQYLDGAADTIFHTADIQGARAFIQQIRSAYADESKLRAIRAIEDNADLTQEEKWNMIETQWANTEGAAAPFVTWMTDWTNMVAGKTNPVDRVAERWVGRESLNVLANIKARTGQAMIKGSLSSALSNLAPLAQASDISEVGMTKAIMRAAVDFARKDASFYDQFDFTVNRMAEKYRGADYSKGAARVVKSAWNLDTMGMVDNPVTMILTRAYYDQAIADGKTHAQAVEWTNERLHAQMAGRSKGQDPIAFNSKLLGLGTQFKRESARDLIARPAAMYRSIAENESLSKPRKIARTAAATVRGLVWPMVFAEMMQNTIGYAVAISPVHLIVDTLKAFGAIDEDDDEDTIMQDVKQVWEMVENALTGKDAVSTIMEAIGDLLNLEKGEGLDAMGYENTQETVGAILSPLWEEFPLIGSRQGQSGIPFVGTATRLFTDSAQAFDYLFTDKFTPLQKGEMFAQGLGRDIMRTFVPGGNQIAKTVLGATDLVKGYHSAYSANNDALQARYAVETQPLDILQTLAFGPSANEGARKYNSGGYWPLTGEQTQDMYSAAQAGMPYSQYFDAVHSLEDAKDAARAEAQAIRDQAIANGEDPGDDAWANTDPLVMAMANDMGLNDETLDILLNQQMSEGGYNNVMISDGKAYNFESDPDLYWAKAAGFESEAEIAEVLDKLSQTKENHFADGLLPGGELQYAYKQRMDALGLTESQQQYILQYLDDQDAQPKMGSLTEQELKDYTMNRYGMTEDEYHMLFEAGGVDFSKNEIDLLLSGMNEGVFTKDELGMMTDAAKYASTAKGVDMDGDGRADTDSIRNEQLRMYIELGLDENQMRLMSDFNERDAKIIDDMETAGRYGLSNEQYMDYFVDGENAMSLNSENQEAMLKAYKAGTFKDLDTMANQVNAFTGAKSVDADGDGEPDMYSKRDAAVQALIDEGADSAQIAAIYATQYGDSTDYTDAMQKAEKAGISPQDFVTAFEGKAASTALGNLDAFIESQKKEVGMDAGQFADMLDIVSNTQGVKDANGETINGSKKYNIYTALKESGLSESQIVWTMTQRKQSDGEPMYKNMELDYAPAGAPQITAGSDGAGQGKTGASAGTASTASTGAYGASKHDLTKGDIKRRNTAIPNYVKNMGVDEKNAAVLWDGLYTITGDGRNVKRMEYLKEAGFSEKAIAWIWNAPQSEGGFGYKSDYRKYYGASSGEAWDSGGSGSSASSAQRQSAKDTQKKAQMQASTADFMQRWGLTGNPFGTSSGGMNYSGYASMLGLTQQAAKRLYDTIPLLAPLGGSALVSHLRGMGLTDQAISRLWKMPIDQGGLGRTDDLNQYLAA